MLIAGIGRDFSSNGAAEGLVGPVEVRDVAIDGVVRHAPGQRVDAPDEAQPGGEAAEVGRVVVVDAVHDVEAVAEVQDPAGEEREQQRAADQHVAAGLRRGDGEHETLAETRGLSRHGTNVPATRRPRLAVDRGKPATRRHNGDMTEKVPTTPVRIYRS
jgi:hypothetical protein